MARRGFSVFLMCATLAGAAQADDDARRRQLEQMLQPDKSFKVRAAAAVALGRLGDPSAVRALGDLLRSADHYAVSAAAASALGRLGSADAIPHLLGGLVAYREPFVLDEVRKSLARYHRLPFFRPHFEDALSDVQTAVRLAAVDACGNILVEDARSASPAIQTDLANHLLAALADDEERIRGAAAKTLARLSHDRAIPVLRRGVLHPDQNVRRWSAQMLEKRADQSAVNDLIAALLQEGHRDVRGALRSALRQHRSFIDVAAHRTQATDDATPQDERIRSLMILGGLGGKDAMEVLSPTMKHKDLAVRTAAARSLALVGSREAKLVIEEAEQREKDPRAKARLKTLLKASF